MSRGITIQFNAVPYTLQASVGKIWAAASFTGLVPVIPPPIGASKTVKPDQAIGSWIPPGQTSPATNYQTIAAAIAAQVAGDTVQIWAPTGQGISAAAPFIYNEQLNFKGATNGLSTNPVLWTVAPNNYIRLKKAFGLIATGYGSANGSTWNATTDWSCGQGLIHFENNQYINLDFRTTSGTGQALEVGDPSEWSPGNYGVTGVAINPAPYTYSNYQSLTIVSSSHCSVRGAWIHGGSNPLAGYAGWDCAQWLFDYCWWDRHGTNYGYQNISGIGATGDMFNFYGNSSKFTNCKGTYCGHGSGPAIWGYNNIVDGCDFSGDWSTFPSGFTYSSYNTGKAYGYVFNCFSGNLDQYIPTLPTTYPSNIQCGPNVLQNSRLIGGGPGELNGTPYINGFSWNFICRQNMFTVGLSANQNGHNVQLASETLTNQNYTSTVLVGRNKFYHNSVYGTPGIYDGTDAGVTVSINADSYARDGWLNNVYDDVTDSGSTTPYLIRHYQTTSQAGNNTYARNNKGSQFYGNILNGPSASGNTDGGGHVYSRTLAFGAYSSGASTTLCDVLDNGTIFPGDVFSNRYLTTVPWVNKLTAKIGTLLQAQCGLVLSPTSSDGIGTGSPITTVASSSSGTTLTVVDSSYFQDGLGISYPNTYPPDYIAVVPVANSGTTGAQIVQIVAGGIDRSANTINITPAISVGMGDKLYLVLSDSVTIAINEGRNIATLSPPTGLQVTGVSTSTVSLSWGTSTNPYIQDYGVYRNGALLGYTTSSTYTDTGLAFNTSYNYSVTSRNVALLESAQSNTITGTTANSSSPTFTVSGLVSNGSTLTITANAPFFGPKSYGTGSPWFADTINQQIVNGVVQNAYSGFTDGHSIGHFVYGQQSDDSGAGTDIMRYYTSRPTRTQFDTALMATVGMTLGKGYVGFPPWPAAYGTQNNQTLYISWWARSKFGYAHTSGGSSTFPGAGDDSTKFCRMSQQGDFGTRPNYNYFATGGGGYTSALSQTESNFASVLVPGGVQGFPNQWVRHELWWDQNAGTLNQWFNGQFIRFNYSGFGGLYEASTPGNVLYASNRPTNSWWNPQQYSETFANITPASIGFDDGHNLSTNNDFDIQQVYVDPDLQRPELANQSTWDVGPTSSMQRELQYQFQIISPTQLSVTLAQGAFSSLDGLNLYWVTGRNTATLLTTLVIPSFLIRTDGTSSGLPLLNGVKNFNSFASADTAGATIGGYGQYQSVTPGTSTTFGAAVNAPVINLTKDYSGSVSGQYLRLDFRQGDQIRLTCMNNMTIQGTGASNFWLDFSNSGNASTGVGGWTKLNDSDQTWTVANPTLSTNSPQRSLYLSSNCNNFRLTGNTGSIFYGGNNGGYFPFWIDGTCHDYTTIGLIHYLNGSNNSGVNGVVSDGAFYEGSNAYLNGITSNLGGHDALVCQAIGIIDSCNFGQYWTPLATGQPGSRCTSFTSNVRSTGEAGTKTGPPYGPTLIQNCNWNDSGAWGASEKVNHTKISGKNIILRNSFFADNNQEHAMTIQLFGQSSSGTTQTTSYAHVYNNTFYNCSGFLRVYDQLNTGVGDTACPTDLEGHTFMNNLYMAGVSTESSLYDYLFMWQCNSIPIPLNRQAGGTWRNPMKGGRVEGNLFNLTTASATAKQITVLGVSGGATFNIDSPPTGYSSIDQNNTSNVTNNQFVTTSQVVLPNVGTSPKRSGAGIYPGPGSTIGIGDRPALTTVTAANGTTTCTLNDAAFFAAGWMSATLLQPERAAYNDILWINGTPYPLTSINYVTNQVTSSIPFPANLIGAGVWLGSTTQAYKDAGSIQSVPTGANFDYYISTTGSDSNSGTLASPWAITAINTKQSTYGGKRVGIIAGTYDVSSLASSTFHTPRLNINGGTSSSAKTYIASCTASGIYSARAATLDAKGASGFYGGANNSINAIIGQGFETNVGPNKGNWTIDGLRLTGFSLWAVHVGNYDGSGGIVPNCTIQNCEITGGSAQSSTTASGVNLGNIVMYAHSNCLIDNCYLHDNFGWTDSVHYAAMYVWGGLANGVSYGLTIQRCTLVNTGTIYGKTDAGAIYGTTIQQCYIDMTTKTPSGGQAMAIEGFSSPTSNATYGAGSTFRNIICVGGMAMDLESQQSPGADQWFYPMACYNNTYDLAGGAGQIAGGSVGYRFWEASGKSALFSFYNNLFYDNGASSISPYGYAASNVDGFAVCDYNIYGSINVFNTYPAGATTGNTSRTFATWKTAIGNLEVHSTTNSSNPFTNNGVHALKYQTPTGVAAGTGKIGGLSTGASVNVGAWDGTVTQIGSQFNGVYD